MRRSCITLHLNSEMRISKNEKEPCVSRRGKIVEIDDENVFVNILNMSACSECRAKEACPAFDKQEKIIRIRNNGQCLAAGDIVDVKIKISHGLKAALIAYILPLTLLMVALITLAAAGLNEIAAGLIAVGLLALYYFALYLSRNGLNRQFDFFIEKSSDEY